MLVRKLNVFDQKLQTSGDILLRSHYKYLEEEFVKHMHGYNTDYMFPYYKWSSDEMCLLLEHLTGVGCTLTWSKRMKIALDAAKGLAFLHGAERSIIYRDLKTANILLDEVSY